MIQKKGGRISATKAAFASALSIKAIITLVDGAVEVAAKARGRKNALDATLKLIKDSNVDETMPMAICYSGNDKTILHNYIEASKADGYVNMENWIEVSVGSTIGTYAGPDSILVGFFTK